MKAQESAQEAKRMTRETIIRMALNKELSWIQAAEICKLSARHVRRLRIQYESVGELRGDGRRGRSMPRRVDEETERTILRLRRSRYWDLSVKHFHEKLVSEHGIGLGYTWTRILLVRAGLHVPAAGPGQHRRKRERRPMRGMMLHCDASTHDWLGDGRRQDLVIVVDDADSRLLYAHFEQEEGTLSTLRALHHVLSSYGRFGEFYTDRGSHFCRTSQKHEGPDEVQQGQVTRALQSLSISQILARSPQARGRCERVFRTLQGRLPQELRLQGIRSYEEANRYLWSHYIAAHNRQFTVAPQSDVNAFVPLVGLDLSLLLSAQHERSVRADNTVSFQRCTLQIPAGPDRVSYAKCKVRVHEFTDETWGVSFGGRLLARYNLGGQLLLSPEKTKRIGSN